MKTPSSFIPKLRLKDFLLPIIVIFTALLIGGVTGYIIEHGFTVSLPFLKEEEEKPLNQLLASDMVSKCSQAGEFCYSNEFAKLTKAEKVETALLVLDEVNRIDPGSRGCHLIAHSISTEETLKDVSQWEEVLSKLPTDKCTGGFLHGVFEARQLKDPTLEINETTIPELCEVVQEKSRGGNDQDCSHIMGHLLVVVHEGDLDKASQTCGRLPESIQYECQSGVYMENETRDGIVDHGLGERIPWNAETTAMQQTLCEEATGIAALACWREISHMYVFISHEYPPQVYKLCAQSGNEEFTDDCYQHAVGIMTATERFQDQYLSILCSPYEGQDEKYAYCVGMGVGSMMSSSAHFTDRVVDFCNEVPFRFREGCFERMGERLARIVPVEKLVHYCKDVPYPYQKRCEHPYL